MNFYIYRPGRVLIAAFVIGFFALDLTARAYHTHRVDQALWGIGGMLLAGVLGFYSLRWIVRRSRAFFQ